MPRLKLTLSYVGTYYHGWQTQSCRGSKDQSLPTIQSILEEAVSYIIGYHVHIHGSGRTDSGVHADGQVAHLDIPEDKQNLDWQCALHALLPPDIRIVDFEFVSKAFHAQHNAIKKIYAYRLWLCQKYTPPHMYPFVWSCGRLDIQAMDEASRCLVGIHDFSSLQNRGTTQKSTVRNVYAIYRQPVGILSIDEHELVWFFEANGFLKQMVRNMIGLLVMVGRGRIKPQEIPILLNSDIRNHTILTAPAHGLTLKNVLYS